MTQLIDVTAVCMTLLGHLTAVIPSLFWAVWLSSIAIAQLDEKKY